MSYNRLKKLNIIVGIEILMTILGLFVDYKGKRITTLQI